MQRFHILSRKSMLFDKASSSSSKLRWNWRLFRVITIKSLNFSEYSLSKKLFNFSSQWRNFVSIMTIRVQARFSSFARLLYSSFFWTNYGCRFPVRYFRLHVRIDDSQDSCPYPIIVFGFFLSSCYISTAWSMDYGMIFV